MRNCNYLLDCIENASKERIDTSKFTIEHVMPQNEDLCPEWQTMLGPDWKTIQGIWLHRLGNVTLTGYNSEYRDKPFEKKKTVVPGGFNESPLRLNKFIRDQQSWAPPEMEQRGKDLARKAVGIWPVLTVDIEAVRESELMDRKLQAAKYSLDDLSFDSDARTLFETMRAQICALGDDVVELFGPTSVTYRVYDFFVEVIPRKRSFLVLLNLDFDECDDPSARAEDAERRDFVPNATEHGGVLLNVREGGHISAAMHLIRQAYEKVAD
jgi:predicted transport protein